MLEYLTSLHVQGNDNSYMYQGFKYDFSDYDFDFSD